MKDGGRNVRTTEWQENGPFVVGAVWARSTAMSQRSRHIVSVLESDGPPA